VEVIRDERNLKNWERNDDRTDKTKETEGMQEKER
jgi:hypothetical protein